MDLEHLIIRAIQMQIGDGAWLTIERDSALRPLETVQPVSIHIKHVILLLLTTSIACSDVRSS